MEEKGIPIHIEVLVKGFCSETHENIEKAVVSFLESNATHYSNGYIDFGKNEYLCMHCEAIRITDVPERDENIPFWKSDLLIHLYTMGNNGATAEFLDETSDITAYHEWMLPNKDFSELWDRLVYDSSVKTDLLNYITCAFYFSQSCVNPSIISLNRVVLLHGPPGTGKTSLCKALAQKLSIRYYSRFSHIALIEINSHSLFSKWFSESGKLVMKLFDYIHDILSTQDTMLFVLIDEVESLSASRKASLSGSEPSDGMRVVNALLTQIDKLRNNPNVMILTTSNLSSSIDDAFVDRADIIQYIGNPGKEARYCILKDCVDELTRTGIIQKDTYSIEEYHEMSSTAESVAIDEQALIRQLFDSIVLRTEGYSGRALRKLPFQAYYLYCCGKCLSLTHYLTALGNAIEVSDDD